MAGLLLVEDEEAIQQKLVYNIDWAEQGFDRVFTANNGLEALKVLENNSIDIMVTDVQMPKMNGIELLKEVRKQEYRMKVIVISGFAEFEYAQESLKLGVSDYLLKPFASKKLLGIVLRLKTELEREQAEKFEARQMREQLQKNMVSLREKLFLDLINGNAVAANPGADLKFLGLTDLEGRLFQVAVLEIPESRLRKVDEEEKYLLNLIFYRHVQDRLAKWNGRYWVINNRLNQITLVVFDPDTQLPMLLEELLDQLQPALDQPLTIGVGHPYRELKDMSISYQEACVALQYRYLHGSGRVFSINDVNLDNPFYHKYFYTLHQNRIFDDLRIGSFQTTRQDLTKLFEELRRARLNPESLRIIAGNIILLTCATLNELGHNPNEIFGTDFKPLAEVDRADSLAELEKYLLDIFARVNEYVDDKRTSLNQHLIDEIRRYIDNHFASEVTLSGIASQYKISPGYLSLLFSERIGKNFSDYLTELRIKKAKELLKHSDMKIYEISNAVGYSDSYYFSSCFKKIVGATPSEYREKLNAKS
ncbi:MAG TPA: response regulator [Bacillota bacterium]|nr:response regulator [Bacillota bacterium]